MKKMSKKKSMNRSNPAGWGGIGWDSVERNYEQVAEESNLKDTHDGDRGVWLNKNSEYFKRKRFDLKGLTASNWENSWSSKGMDKVPLMVLEHSGYDTEYNTDKTIYSIDFTLDRITDAYSKKDGGNEREWYFDHISAYLIDGTTGYANLEEDHSRNNPSKITNSDGEIGLCHPYERLFCLANQAVAIGTRGFEKDRNEPDSYGYVVGWRDYIDLYKDLFKALESAKWGKFLFDCIGIAIRKVISNPDDKMVPCVIVLTHGACRWIHEELGGKITFSKYIVGDESTPNVVQESGGDYVELIDDVMTWDTSDMENSITREYTLHYFARVFRENEIDPEVYYLIKNEVHEKQMCANSAYAYTEHISQVGRGSTWRLEHISGDQYKIKNNSLDQYLDENQDPKYSDDYTFGLSDEGAIFHVILVRTGYYKILYGTKALGVGELLFSDGTSYCHLIMCDDSDDDELLWNFEAEC